MTPKLRVWVVFGSRLKFGDGRARLLELIDERGSLRQAAAEFDMSYRNAWGYLRELEQAAGFELVARSPKGTLRSGMRLTPRGREFLALEVKAQSRFSTPQLSGLRAIADLPRLVRRVLVYLGDRRLKTEDGIEVWPLDTLIAAIAQHRFWP